MSHRVVFDVYGRFRVSAEQAEGGTWVLHRLGSDGKRTRLNDVILPDDASLDDLLRGLEATCHESARPGTSITRIDA